MPLFALVLLAALLLEDNDLFTASVANDLCFNGSVASNFCVLARTNDERLNIDRTTLFALDTRHTERLAVFDRKLLATSFNDCVTHCLFISTAKVDILPDSRKVEIIRKTLIPVKPELKSVRLRPTRSGVDRRAIIKYKNNKGVKHGRL